ncbi:DUF262 domain-containing protein [Kordia sp.]|uniref:DUF262 domain-containing protein n=1 Tax=Kordia sp. TaxID=1965332 RepID=UPI003B5A1A9A
MALSLTAEQREILKIFKIDEQYVIPAYQRPYSWGYDQCIQLFNDLFEAFRSDEEYFIGNIIIAKSESTKDKLEVIDGQQRLTTLLLLIKVLYLFQPELKVLRTLLEQENWEGNETKPRIISNIFEAKDREELNAILKYDMLTISDRFQAIIGRNNKPNWKKTRNKFERNLLFFYSWIQYQKKQGTNLKEFIGFILKKIYLLPIELTGKSQEEANEKALIIFETINNRGMNLEDADIFKAKLFKKAEKVQEGELFIESWIEFKYNCQNLKLEVDDIFRYYSHIIRGKNKITSSEINLREFFVREHFSPFELKKYKEIMKDLFTITEVLEFINQNKNTETELAKWLQLIESYTNQYPKFAVVTYLFTNGLEINPQLINSLTSIVRYVYYQGSTTRVKFEIYNIIKQICSKQEIGNYYVNHIDISHFNHLGKLKYGFALLAFYSNREKAIQNFNVDKIISLKDQTYLTQSWKNTDLETITDDLGNFAVLDIPKRNVSLIKKIEYYKSSQLLEIINLNLHDFTFDRFKNRDLKLKKILINFFNGNNE